MDFGAGNLDIMNNNGSLNSVFMALPGGANGAGNGITTNPVNGHIYVDSGNGINDIDPVTASVRHVNNVIGDGIAVSPDGSTVYVSQSGVVIGYSTATGAATGFSVSVAGVDGIAIIQPGNLFSNYIIVNTNNGVVDLINPTGTTVTAIANGGSRGDFVGIDRNNGSLFLTQTDSVDRLTCGPGCFATTGTPEPGGIWLTMIGLGWVMRKRIFGGARLAVSRDCDTAQPPPDALR